MKLSAIILFLAVSCASAGPDIAEIKWQVPLQESPGKKTSYITISEWKQGYLNQSPGHMRILVSVANRSGKPIEGSVIRCAVSMHLAPVDQPGTQGVWAVPFWVEQRRVPKIKPAQALDVAIPHIDLQGNLKRLRGTGFWPDAFKVQIMAEPRLGDNLEKSVVESVISVIEEKKQ